MCKLFLQIFSRCSRGTAVTAVADGSGGYVGGPCPLGDSWQYDREEGEWTKLEDCSSPVNDGAMISVRN